MVGGFRPIPCNFPAQQSAVRTPQALKKKGARYWRKVGPADSTGPVLQHAYDTILYDHRDPSLLAGLVCPMCLSVMELML